MGESRGEQLNRNLGAQTVSARRQSGAAVHSRGVPALLSFPPFIPRATLLPLTTTTAKGHAETGVFLEASFTVQEEEGPHIRPPPLSLLP